MLVMQTASQLPVVNILRHESYPASFKTMSTLYFFSSSLIAPSSPLISSISSATPNTDQLGYSLQASVKVGAGPALELALSEPFCAVESVFELSVLLARNWGVSAAYVC